MPSVVATLDPLLTSRGLARCPRTSRWARQAHGFGVVVEMHRRVASKTWTLGWGLWVVGVLPDNPHCPTTDECHALQRVARFTTTDDLKWEGPNENGVIIETTHLRDPAVVDLARIEDLINTALDELFAVQSAEMAWQFYDRWKPNLPWGMPAFKLALQSVQTSL
jgi:hypothetical protein